MLHIVDKSVSLIGAGIGMPHISSFPWDVDGDGWTSRYVRAMLKVRRWHFSHLRWTVEVTRRPCVSDNVPTRLRETGSVFLSAYIAMLCNTVVGEGVMHLVCVPGEAFSGGI